MKVSIEYIVIGREKKYPDVAGEVFVQDNGLKNKSRNGLKKDTII